MSLVLGQGLQSAPHPARGRRGTTLNDFADQFELALKEKRDLACRLGEALNEIEVINKLYRQRRAEFDSERSRLNAEIESLRAELTQFSKRPDTKPADDGAGVQLLLETREKLVREEFERKYQELTVEVRQQRKKYTDQIAEMKKQISNCICKASH